MSVFRNIKTLFLGPPERPSSPERSKRKASSDFVRKTKYPRHDEPYSPRDYQKGSDAGSVTLTTTDEESGEDRARAGPSLSRNKSTTLRTVLHESKKQSSPKRAVSPDKIQKAAEGRYLLSKAHERYESIGNSEAERLGASIGRLETRAETMAKHLSTATQTRKGKEPAMPIQEFQPLSDTSSEIDPNRNDGEDIYTPPSLHIGERPEGWEEFTTQQKWQVKPNLRARELVAENLGRAKVAIEEEIEEPEYALRHAEIRDDLWQIMDQMERFAQEFFRFQFSPGKDGAVSNEWYQSLTPQTAKIIGCVASGGPAGVHGWHDLFINEQKRRALVCGIIGNVLVEQVFQHMFFGGRATNIQAVFALQEKHRNEDGFDRNKHYAVAIRKILAKNATSETLILPANFNNHVNQIVSALWTHLAPILHLNSRGSYSSRIAEIPDDMFIKLHELIVQAGLLSLHMRIDPHTVYYFEPVFKEYNFTSQRMECFNSRDMQQRHPRYTPEELLILDAKEQKRRANISDAEKKRAKNDEPLTQITIMDGITAYRLGGWETADSSVLEPSYEKSEYRSQGSRQRILTHGWVYCRWGRPRRYEDGRPNDDATIHGDAWKGGFVEFTDVDGVPNWSEMERDEKRKAREVREG